MMMRRTTDEEDEEDGTAQRKHEDDEYNAVDEDGTAHDADDEGYEEAER